MLIGGNLCCSLLRRTSGGTPVEISAGVPELARVVSRLFRTFDLAERARPWLTR
jgi:hypothetical protein